MGLFGRLGNNPARKADAAARAWRDAWAHAVAARDAGAATRLETALRHQPPFADDLEIEEEMLHGLRQLLDLDRELAASRLPRVETRHRMVGSDVCHFSAPVSMPDESSQPTGRLLFTSTRAAFAGGFPIAALPWHAMREVVQAGRDLLLVRTTEDGHRFRCNSYADVLCATAIARYLVRQARGTRL